jgi:hypothetical protein
MSSPRRKHPAGARRRTVRRWSQQVTEHSNAMDLEKGVFQRSPRGIALSLRRSAERSGRRKAPAFQSAMSMLNFYANRAGRNLSAPRKRVLQQARDELRKLYGRPVRAGARPSRRRPYRVVSA